VTGRSVTSDNVVGPGEAQWGWVRVHPTRVMPYKGGASEGRWGGLPGWPTEGWLRGEGEWHGRVTGHSGYSRTHCQVGWISSFGVLKLQLFYVWSANAQWHLV